MAVYMPPSTGGDFEPPPEGAHIGVCFRVIDLGTQDTTFQGVPSKKHQLLISWELPDERMQDGRPFTIGKSYTYSSSPKSNLRKDLESWRGKRFDDKEIHQFDVSRLIGIGCMLNVVHSEKNETTYANVATIMRLPRGTAAPELTNEAVSLSLNERPFDRASFEKLSDRLREKIARSPEYQLAAKGLVPPSDEEPPPASEGDYGSDIPF